MDNHGFPAAFQDLLGAPAFVIHLSGKQPQRWDTCAARLAEAGFADVRRFEAVDGRDAERCMDLYKNTHRVAFNLENSWHHGNGCMLSHLGVWKHILDAQIPFATIFEDDVFFHSRWDALAPQYYEATPKPCDMFYMGHHCGNAIPNAHIQQSPAYCLQAYAVTLQGAQKLYKMITQYPYQDRDIAIDLFLVRLQREIVSQRHRSEVPDALDWFVWNAEMFPDPDPMWNHRIDPQHIHKEKGLVFQELLPK